MIIIGVTGNTGAGKSTVSTIIKNNTRALVIDADKIAKELMVPGNEYFNKVIDVLGEDVLHKNGKNKGKINRANFSKIIFTDSEKLKKVNTLTFKYVGLETKKILTENKEKEFVVLDFPLLFEGKFNKLCNYIISVVSDEETKISRIKERDKIDDLQAKNRINSQLTDEFYKENSTYVVNNGKNVRYLNLVNDVLKIIHEIKNKEMIK